MEGGGEIDIIAAFGEMSDPILGNGRAPVSNEEEFHNKQEIAKSPPGEMTSPLRERGMDDTIPEVALTCKP